jgi:hypothetical protein
LQRELIIYGLRIGKNGLDHRGIVGDW